VKTSAKVRLNTIIVLQGGEYCSQQCSHFDLLPKDESFSFCRMYGQFMRWGSTNSGAFQGDSAPVRLQVCFDDSELTIDEEF
jgi:hypothetical protein